MFFNICKYLLIVNFLYQKILFIQQRCKGFDFKNILVKYYMHVSFTFSPTPEVVWLKNNVTLPGTNKVSVGGQELTIANLTEDDAGQYECLGTNPLGSRIFRSFVVRVECKDKRNIIYFLTFVLLFKRYIQ